MPVYEVKATIMLPVTVRVRADNEEAAGDIVREVGNGEHMDREGHFYASLVDWVSDEQMPEIGDATTLDRLPSYHDPLEQSAEVHEVREVTIHELARERAELAKVEVGRAAEALELAKSNLQRAVVAAEGVNPGSKAEKAPAKPKSAE